MRFCLVALVDQAVFAVRPLDGPDVVVVRERMREWPELAALGPMQHRSTIVCVGLLESGPLLVDVEGARDASHWRPGC